MTGGDVIVLSTGQAVIFIWFAAAVVIEIVSGLWLYEWLRRKKVNVSVLWMGVPGYLERAYLGWCRRNGQSGKRVLTLRYLSKISVVASSLLLIATLAASTK
jgi:hypothetical protein